MKKITIQMNGWFNTRCDLMAWDGEDSRKSFEVLSKDEGQAIAWWLKNLARVKKEVLAFSWGTNQAMMIMSMWRIKSILDKVLEVTWCFCSYSYLMNGIKSHAQDGYAQVKRSISTCWHPHLMKIERHDISLEKINSRGLNSFFPLILSL